jgi:hypothetical protein
VANWPAIEAELSTRATQTNEAGRCALLLPVLAALPQPLALCAAEPPTLVRGDLVDDLPRLVAQAPPDATLVVFHTSVLYQVSATRRAAFARLAGEQRGHWVAVEAPSVLTYSGLPAPPDRAFYNVLALDGVPLAWTRGHGEAMAWFA